MSTAIVADRGPAGGVAGSVWAVCLPTVPRTARVRVPDELTTTQWLIVTLRRWRRVGIGRGQAANRGPPSIQRYVAHSGTKKWSGPKWM